MFSFNIKKPADIHEALKSVEYKIKSSGGAFSGDEQSGVFANRARDVTGQYSVGADAIRITITRKPFLYPDSVVESRIREYFE